MSAPAIQPPPRSAAPRVKRDRRAGALITRSQLREAAIDAFVRLDPRYLVRNPVMFTVAVGAVLTALFTVRALFGAQPFVFALVVTIWLGLTVVFANFSDAIAEARGRAQAASLRATRTETSARRRHADGSIETVPGTSLHPGDIVVVEAGEIIPSDGDIIEGGASVDEAAITGESAPVLREAGTDRSGVTGGTRVLSDRIVVRIDASPGDTFLDKMIRLVEGAERQRTPNEIALSVLLAGLTLTFVIVCVTLPAIAGFLDIPIDRVTLVALFVCLIPTTIGGLLPAIGIAGMDRALRANVIAKSGRAVEICGDIDLLLLDKTGTITVGARQATEFTPLAGVTEAELRQVAALASLDDPTPEGKSIVSLAARRGTDVRGPRGEFIPFSATTRMSGVDLPDRRLRKGAASQIVAWITKLGGHPPAGLQRAVDEIARTGGTPLAVSDGPRILGVVALTDVLKPGIRDRFARLRAMGLETVMITGDNPLTAAAIAAEAGVDGFLAEATPEDKLARIRSEQAGGKLVAMMGDGTNDAPALAQADVGLAMNAGTQPAKEAANLIDLDSDPTKLLEVVEIGKQLLLTRGALTTFSIANDVAKYFAILPALFVGSLGGLEVLDVMDLTSERSAILSAVIFNALVIPALVPLALRGVQLRAASAEQLLVRNLLIYGVGGVIAPFVGIKVIDVLLTLAGLA